MAARALTLICCIERDETGWNCLVSWNNGILSWKCDCNNILVSKLYIPALTPLRMNNQSFIICRNSPTSCCQAVSKLSVGNISEYWHLQYLDSHGYLRKPSYVLWKANISSFRDRLTAIWPNKPLRQTQKRKVIAGRKETATNINVAFNQKRRLWVASEHEKNMHIQGQENSLIISQHLKSLTASPLHWIQYVHLVISENKICSHSYLPLLQSFIPLFIILPSLQSLI